MRANAPIQLISTDFDGTIFAEFEQPPIAQDLERQLAHLQTSGVKWIINTGRDMSSLMEALARSRVSIQPDFLVLVEREIYQHDGIRYVGLVDWNARCAREHGELFARVRPDVPKLNAWVNERFRATVYEDAFSPFCLIADNNGDADVIHDFLEDYCQGVPNLTVVRNDVYARFSHAAFNKGTALTEICRRVNVSPEAVLAAGDHLNDLPMLKLDRASRLVSPVNAVTAVKQAVREQGGFISDLPHGHGVADGLRRALSQ